MHSYSPSVHVRLYTSKTLLFISTALVSTVGFVSPPFDLGTSNVYPRRSATIKFRALKWLGWRQGRSSSVNPW